MGKIPKPGILGKLLIFIFILIIGSFLILNSSYYQQYAPEFARQKSTKQIWNRIAWRAEFYFRKATGGVPELSWAEIVHGTWPTTDFIDTIKLAEGESLDAAIFNPNVSREDVDAGKALFQKNCAACHGNDGTGGHAPSLAVDNYQVGTTDFSLYKTIRDGIPGTPMASFDFSIKERWQIISYLRTLQHGTQFHAKAKRTNPPPNVSWKDITLSPNTASDWLTYSGSLNGWRHSDLAEITKDNISRLKLLWVHQFNTPKTIFEATPIVRNGVIYMSTPPNNVVALDSKTGNELWRYERRLPKELPLCCGSVNRGLAILGNTLFLGSLDAKLVALNATDGTVEWEVPVADPDKGYSITAAPLIVNDLVVVGISGGEFGIRGFLAAYDAKTGEERWRFDTIPGPGEPGHETWKNDAWKQGGGPTWITGSFDADLNILYWGVGNPAPNFAGAVRPGDNLFTNSAVALDPDTGKLIWHFQFTPHDVHDWDSNQTPILADIPVDGQMRKVICWANRNGFYYVLDRTTGEYLTGTPFVDVTWASGLDENGRPVLTENAEIRPEGTLTKPWVSGGTNWQPPSFDPATGTFLVFATDGSSIYTTKDDDDITPGKGGLFLGSGSSIAAAPINMIKALDASTGEMRWKYVVPKANNEFDYTGGGVLSTAGHLVFSSVSGRLIALNSDNGELLWKANLGGNTKAAPITFSVDGRQVIAVTAGKALFVFGMGD